MTRVITRGFTRLGRKPHQETTRGLVTKSSVFVRHFGCKKAKLASWCFQKANSRKRTGIKIKQTILFLKISYYSQVTQLSYPNISYRVSSKAQIILKKRLSYNQDIRSSLMVNEAYPPKLTYSVS